MAYSHSQVEDLEFGQLEVASQLANLAKRYVTEIGYQSSVDEAKQFAMHGVSRRLMTLRACISNVFDVFPPSRTRLLNRDELSDIQINLHAFFINVFGVLDCAAWVFLLHHGIFGNAVKNKSDVGLFAKATQQHLPPQMLALLKEDRVRKWYRSYAKNYRDAIAHRIPVYVPPYHVPDERVAEHEALGQQVAAAFGAGDHEKGFDLMEAQAQLGSPSLRFAHGFSKEDAAPQLIHPQLLNDSRLVVEILSGLL